MPMSGGMRLALHRLLAVGVVPMIAGGCSDVISGQADASRDIPAVDAAIDSDRHYTAEELNCRASICPNGYICVDQCENGVCGPNHYQCRLLPVGCTEPPPCTNATEPCACPMCLASLCPPSCSYQGRGRNVVDCNR